MVKPHGSRARDLAVYLYSCERWGDLEQGTRALAESFGF
jgi:hypothetical protein